MLISRIRTLTGFCILVSMLILACLVKIQAHCDTLDGPVVTDARRALEDKNVTRVLKWVTVDNEQEIRSAFDKTLLVREKGIEAQEIADTYFFETLVRLHRAGEGAAYTGLKPAGSEVDPAVTASDRAIEIGSVDDLAEEIAGLVATGIRERFERVLQTRKQMDESVAFGREYVESYITFVHYVEELHAVASRENANHEHLEK